MILNLVEVKGKTRKDLIDAIYEMSEVINADFNGDNGVEYTSDEALEGGFENDLEYYVDCFSNIEDDAILLNEMLKAMCNYADEVKYEYILDENRKVKSIAVAIIQY